MEELKTQILECGQCHRKMVVQDAMVGVDHSAGTYIFCWECLTPEQQEKVAKEVNKS